jgi:hypothetical protein
VEDMSAADTKHWHQKLYAKAFQGKIETVLKQFKEKYSIEGSPFDAGMFNKINWDA